MDDKPADNKAAQNRSRSKSQSRRGNNYTNPYLNFLRDFQSSNIAKTQKGPAVFKTAGEKWRAMSDAEKAPYMNAAKEAKNRQRKKSKDKTEKKDGKPEGKVEQKRACKHNMAPKTCCSKCGHRHGSPFTREENTLSWRQRRALRHEASREPDTDETRSRSRTREYSRDETPTSDSSTTL